MVLSTYLVELIFVATLQKHFTIVKKTNQHSISCRFPNSRFSLVSIPAFPFFSKYLMGYLRENGKARIFTSFAIE
jgi:hypothetical protein